jgi:hypothetical protein
MIEIPRVKFEDEQPSFAEMLVPYDHLNSVVVKSHERRKPVISTLLDERVDFSNRSP